MKGYSLPGILLVVIVLLASFSTAGLSAQDSTQSSTSTGTPPPAREGTFEARWATQADGVPIRVHVEAGESKDLTLEMVNPSIAPFELRAYTADVHTRVNGGIILEPEGSEMEAPGTWLPFPTTIIPLEPGQSASQTMTVTVPPETPPGEYVNAVAVETVEDYSVGDDSAFRQRIRKVLLIFIEVPGEMRTGFKLGEPAVDLTQGFGIVVIPIENTGNVRIRPSGEINVRDTTGKVLMTLPVQIGYIYGGDATFIAIQIENPLPPGEYLLDITMEDAELDVSQTIEGATLAMPEIEPPQPLDLANVSITPNADPIQFAFVSVDIVNQSAPVLDATLTMSVFKDGKHVEDFVLSSSLDVARGTFPVQQRYIPLTGFESGTYTFSLTLTIPDQDEPIAVEEEAATLDVP